VREEIQRPLSLVLCGGVFVFLFFFFLGWVVVWGFFVFFWFCFFFFVFVWWCLFVPVPFSLSSPVYVISILFVSTSEY